MSFSLNLNPFVRTEFEPILTNPMRIRVPNGLGFCKTFWPFLPVLWPYASAICLNDIIFWCMFLEYATMSTFLFLLLDVYTFVSIITIFL